MCDRKFVSKESSPHAGAGVLINLAMREGPTGPKQVVLRNTSCGVSNIAPTEVACLHLAPNSSHAHHVSLVVIAATSARWGSFSSRARSGSERLAREKARWKPKRGALAYCLAPPPRRPAEHQQPCASSCSRRSLSLLKPPTQRAHCRVVDVHAANATRCGSNE